MLQPIALCLPTCDPARRRNRGRRPSVTGQRSQRTVGQWPPLPLHLRTTSALYAAHQDLHLGLRLVVRSPLEPHKRPQATARNTRQIETSALSRYHCRGTSAEHVGSAAV